MTEGEPGSYWAKKTLDFLRGRGVGVITSIANDAMAANTLNAVSERVYKIPLDRVIKAATRTEQARLAQLFGEHPELAAFAAPTGMFDGRLTFRAAGTGYFRASTFTRFF